MKKKIRFVILAAALVIIIALVAVSAALRGDLNNDNLINDDDLNQIIENIANGSEYASENDIKDDNDSKVNVLDAIALKNHIASLDNPLPSDNWTVYWY